MLTSVVASVLLAHDAVIPKIVVPTQGTLDAQQHAQSCLMRHTASLQACTSLVCCASSCVASAWC